MKPHQQPFQPPPRDGRHEDRGKRQKASYEKLGQHEHIFTLAWRASTALDSRGVAAYLGGTMAKAKDNPNYKVVAENRRARYDYAIEDDIECGIQLMGSEVKSLRTGQSNISESYAAVEDGELWLVNSYIAPYEQAMFGHEDRRKRKLLVSKKQLSDLWNATRRKGMTLVPLVLYFNHRGMAKVKIGIAKGKKVHDKRETEAQRDWNRQKQRLMKDHG
jgi:SsrA-binding protein